MISLRRRLLLGTAVATACVFLAAAVSIYWLSRNFLIAEFDSGLRSKAQIVASMVEFRGERIGVDGHDLERFPEYINSTPAEYYRIRTDDGRIARSPTLRAVGDPEIPTAGFLNLPDGRRGRAVSVYFESGADEDDEPKSPAAGAPAAPEAGAPTTAAPPTPDRGGMTLTLARATTELDRLLSRLRWLLVGVCAAGTLLLLGGAALVIRRSIRPIDQLARDIAAIGADDLEERLATRVPRELNPIVARLNEMLCRLEQTFEREKCFTSDAAHELRTPLAGLQVALEVCAAHRREPPHYEHVIGECLKVVQRMHAMIDNLLLLARADDDRVDVCRVEVDLVELLRDGWSHCRLAAEARALHVQWTAPPTLPVSGDPAILSTIFGNLLDNAVQYTNETGQIRIRAVAGEAATITIENTGCRVAPADAHRVFDRFWRADSSRTAAGKHCGLGLTVCRKLAAALGAQLTARSTDDGWFTIELSLPAQSGRKAAAKPTSEVSLSC